MRVIVRFLAFSCMLLEISSLASAGQWCNWRGPLRNGSSLETGLPANWTTTEKIKWKTVLEGTGSSTPVISGDYVFVTTEVGEGKDLTAVCIDRNGGQIRWQKVMGHGSAIMRNNNASPSAVADGGNVYFFFGTGDLACFDYDGKLIWKRNLERDYGKISIKFGLSSSPLLYNRKIYISMIQSDSLKKNKSGEQVVDSGYLLAVDAGTGRTIWKHVRPVSAPAESQEAYTTPTLCRYSAGTQIVIIGGDCVTGHDIDSGVELWRWSGYNRKNSDMHRVITSPVFIGNAVIMCEPRHLSIFALHLDRTGAVKYEDVVWKAPDLGADATTPLYFDGMLYVLDGDRKIMHALNPETGAVSWSGQIESHAVFRASPTGADGKIYCINEDGEVTVLRAGPRFDVLSQIPMGGKMCRASIAVSDGCLFVRTSNELFCVSEK